MQGATVEVELLAGEANPAVETVKPCLRCASVRVETLKKHTCRFRISVVGGSTGPVSEGMVSGAGLRITVGLRLLRSRI